MKRQYRFFIGSLVLHSAVIIALGSLAMSSFRESPSTIEVELIMGEDAAGPELVRASEFRPDSSPRKKQAILKTEVASKLEAVASEVPEATEPEANRERESEKESEKESEADTLASSTQSSATSSSQTGRGRLLSMEQQYLAEVRRLLESKKNYPMAARRLGHQGRVIVRFVVGRDGQIREARITEASTSEILNRAARSLIENIGLLQPFPSEIRLAEWAVVVPIEYQM